MSTLGATTPRLTKKQRKSQAHRERGKLRRAQLGSLMENGLPASDDTELGDDSGLMDGTGDAGLTPGEVQLVTKLSSKRARNDDDGTGPSSTKLNKIRRLNSEDAEEPAQNPVPEQIKLKKKKARYILFVGNLSYTTTAEAIAKHFTIRAPKSKEGLDSKPTASKPAKRPNVRLGTTKGSDASKGYAFVEYTEPGDLQRGLSLHHTALDGRQINVEMTAGGGGNTEKRRQKVMEKNKKVLEQRMPPIVHGLLRNKLQRTADSRPRPPSNYGETTVRYSSTSGEARPATTVSSANAEPQKSKPRSSKRKPAAVIQPDPVASGANATPASRRWSTKPKPASKPKDGNTIVV
ncbi:hypothetical protein FRB98_002089 [Tulasnella sp. 332]|nr:hypothetical protein FRB98_002089 [Tulasnella sp. 332]